MRLSYLWGMEIAESAPRPSFHAYCHRDNLNAPDSFYTVLNLKGFLVLKYW